MVMSCDVILLSPLYNVGNRPFLLVITEERKWIERSLKWTECSPNVPRMFPERSLNAPLAGEASLSADRTHRVDQCVHVSADRWNGETVVAAQSDNSRRSLPHSCIHFLQ
jgi:hypothetical protein